MAIQVLTKDGLTTYHGKLKEVYFDKMVYAESGKGLSSNDYTTAEKTKLGGIAEGAQVNVIESVKVDGVALTVSEKGVNIDLSAFAKKADVATAYKPMGSVAVAELPASANVGDVYNITDASDYGPAGTNVVYTENGWDALAGITDLSEYAKSADVSTQIQEATKDMATSETIATINQSITTIQNTMATDDEVAQVKSDLQAEIDADVKVVSDAVALKADASAVYTKGEVDSAIGTATADMATDAELAAVDAKFANYVLSADVTTVSDAEIEALFA